MFIGLVVVIMIISISVLAIVNGYFLAFSNNFGDLNDYYSSKYAAVSAIERGMSEYPSITQSTQPLTGSGLDDGIWTGTRSVYDSNPDDSNPNNLEITGTGKMRDYTNSLTINY